MAARCTPVPASSSPPAGSAATRPRGGVISQGAIALPVARVATDCVRSGQALVEVIGSAPALGPQLQGPFAPSTAEMSDCEPVLVAYPWGEADRFAMTRLRVTEVTDRLLRHNGWGWDRAGAAIVDPCSRQVLGISTGTSEATAGRDRRLKAGRVAAAARSAAGAQVGSGTARVDRAPAQASISEHRAAGLRRLDLQRPAVNPIRRRLCRVPGERGVFGSDERRGRPTALAVPLWLGGKISHRSVPIRSGTKPLLRRAVFAAVAAVDHRPVPRRPAGDGITPGDRVQQAALSRLGCLGLLGLHALRAPAVPATRRDSMTSPSSLRTRAAGCTIPSVVAATLIPMSAAWRFNLDEAEPVRLIVSIPEQATDVPPPGSADQEQETDPACVEDLGPTGYGLVSATLHRARIPIGEVENRPLRRTASLSLVPHARRARDVRRSSAQGRAPGSSIDRGGWERPGGALERE